MDSLSSDEIDHAGPSPTHLRGPSPLPNTIDDGSFTLTTSSDLSSFNLVVPPPSSFHDLHRSSSMDSIASHSSFSYRPVSPAAEPPSFDCGQASLPEQELQSEFSVGDTSLLQPLQYASDGGSSRLTPSPYEDSPPQTRAPSPEPSSTTYDPFQVKHRRRTTAPQLRVLENQFVLNAKPDIPIRKAIADQLGMTPREVQVWFQNRRAKAKRLDRKAQAMGHGNKERQEDEDLPADQEARWSEEAAMLEDRTPILPSGAGAPPKGWVNRRASAVGLPTYTSPHAASDRVELPRKYSLPLGLPVQFPRSAPADMGMPTGQFDALHHPSDSRALPRLHISRPNFSQAPHSAPSDQNFNYSWTQRPDFSAHVTAGRQSIAPGLEHIPHPSEAPRAEKDSAESDYAQYLADLSNRYRQQRNDSITTTASYDQSTGSTTPTSVTSGWSSASGLTTATSDSLPVGFNPDLRRASCPADFIASFGQLMPGIPSSQGLPASTYLPQQMIGAPGYPTYHGYTQRDVFPPFQLPTHHAQSYGQPYYAGMAAQQSGFERHMDRQGAPTFQAAHGSRSGGTPSHEQQYSGGRRMSTSLDPIAELHHPVPFSPTPPQFVFNDHDISTQSDQDGSNPLQRPLITRKARSQTSIKSAWPEQP